MMTKVRPTHAEPPRQPASTPNLTAPMETRLCYQVLDLHPGVSSSLSQTELRQAYKDLVQVWHPDRFAHNPRLRAKAEAKLAQINSAYGTLKSVLERRDRIQASFYKPSAPPTSPSETTPSGSPESGSPESSAQPTAPEPAFHRHPPPSTRRPSRLPSTLRWYLATLAMTLGVIALLFASLILAYWVARQPGLFLVPAIAFFSLYGYRALTVR